MNGDDISSLLPEQIQRLIDLGMGNAHQGPFDFNSEVRNNEWEAKFQLLVAYKNEHGTVEVIRRKERDQQSVLAGWLGEFRQLLRYHF